jgi:hypothetical protein
VRALVSRRRIDGELSKKAIDDIDKLVAEFF